MNPVNKSGNLGGAEDDRLESYLHGLEKCQKMLSIVLSSNANFDNNRARIAYVQGYLSAAKTYLKETK